MRISEIMNKVFVIDKYITLKEAAKMMSDKNVGSLVVTDKEKIVGIITEKDILKNINRLSEKVADVMSKNVVTIDKNDSIENAAELMAENKVKRLPVVYKGELVGIVSSTDIIAHSESLNEDFYFD